MRNGLIACVVLLATAGSAFSQVQPPPKAISVDLGGGVQLELILIPAGSFMMGDDRSRSEYEKPFHTVKITKPFYLGKYEVTQQQWQAVMGSNPSRFPAPKNPVEAVSWDDCQAFLGKLNSHSGEQGGKFVLPTEAQWEYACRAGTATEYSFGEKAWLRDCGWFDSNAERKTHAVGEMKPNAWGLYDMHGNVWEWCADWYGSRYYPQSPPNDPAGPDGGASRVLRGGGWSDIAWACRSMARGNREPELRLNDLGLRVARTLADK